MTVYSRWSWMIVSSSSRLWTSSRLPWATLLSEASDSNNDDNDDDDNVNNNSNNNWHAKGMLHFWRNRHRPSHLHQSGILVSLGGRSHREGCRLRPSECVAQGRAAVSQHLALIMMFLCNVLTLWTITSTKLKWAAIPSLLPPLSLLYLHDLATFVKLPKNSGIHVCSAQCYHPSQKDSEGVGHIFIFSLKSLTTSRSSYRGYACLAFSSTLATALSL